jgi:hypothetical protein
MASIETKEGVMATTKPSWQNVTRGISHWSDDQLRGLVHDLYRLNSVNAEFLNARLLLHTGTDQLLGPYKKRMREAICPKGPWHEDVRLSDARRAISDFKKAKGDVRNTLALMLYYVQCGSDFTLEFGDVDEDFYDSMCSMVDQIKKRLLAKGSPELAAEFLPMLEHEFRRIDGQMGWGYPDEVAEQIAELRARFM